MLETRPALLTIANMNQRGIIVAHSATVGTTATNPVKKNSNKNSKKNGKRAGASPGLLVPRTLPAGTTASSTLR